MRGIILCGGAITDYGYIKKQIKDGDVILCADSGYDHAVRMGLKPEAVVGDFDSIRAVPAGIRTVRYPGRKNLTDSELAVEYARNLGLRDFLLLAATGTRLDHTLTNILLLKDCLERGETAVILDEHNKIMLTDSTARLREPAGSLVSLVPLSDCGGVTTEHLEYPLQDAILHVGKGLGVSNVMTAEHALITVQKGLLLIIVARD